MARRNGNRSEAIVAIVDELTKDVQIHTATNVNKYLDDLRTWSDRPKDLNILAVAFRRGGAIKLVRQKLKNYHVRNSWYDTRAFALIEHVGMPGPFLRLDAWIDELEREAHDTGGITPIASEGPHTRVTPDFDNTTIVRPQGPRIFDVYNHPRRRRGRPRKPEKDTLNVDVFRPEPEKPQSPVVPIEERRTPPAWALALARATTIPRG